MSPREVGKMAFSEFTQAYKCASMLLARERLMAINISNFAQLKEDARVSLQRDLRAAATEHLSQKVKDYREVLGNLAKRLMSGR